MRQPCVTSLNDSRLCAVEGNEHQRHYLALALHVADGSALIDRCWQGARRSRTRASSCGRASWLGADRTRCAPQSYDNPHRPPASTSNPALSLPPSQALSWTRPPLWPDPILRTDYHTAETSAALAAMPLCGFLPCLVGFWGLSCVCGSRLRGPGSHMPVNRRTDADH